MMTLRKFIDFLYKFPQNLKQFSNRNHVNEIAYALGWYSEIIQSKTIDKLSLMLEERCENFEMNGLRDRLHDFESLLFNLIQVIRTFDKN